LTGIELVVGYLIAWGVRKARRVGQAADAEVDQVLDASLEKLHGFVSKTLSGDPSFAALEKESSTGEVYRRTRQRVELALEDAAEGADVRDQLASLVEQVQQAEKSAGVQLLSAGERGIIAGGNVDIRADRSSLAVGTAGDITFSPAPGEPPPDPHQPGPKTG
jgi:hypothetical protein